ncbi:SpoIIE family protein phosphatase [uncultured Megamonas sp.]|uniref:SpoIIE family protein phosphatase n=1 Tax=uncultured Megamonas sp. TaxID=286140 RepID=UPI0025929AD6|nr:SpoIIE family protein phosphatase [uncultured Megamonas sp.]
MIKLHFKSKIKKSISIRKRILTVLLSSCLLSIILTSLIAFKAIYDTRELTLSIGNEIIFQAAENSQEALIQRAKLALEQTAVDKANELDENLGKVKKDVIILSNMMTNIASNPEEYHSRNIFEPSKNDIDKITAQLLFSSEVVDKSSPILRQEIGLTANIQDFLIQINTNSNVIISSYVASKNGFTIMVDRFAGRKFQNSDIKPDFYNATSRPWYIQAKKEDKTIFTDIVIDALGGGPCIICATPYYANGQFAGVVGMGTFLDNINEIILNTKIGDNGFGFVINKQGQIIASPHTTGDLITGINNIKDLRQSTNTSLADAVQKIINEKAGLTEANIDGKDYYLAYAPMKNTDWYFVTAMEVDTVIAPAKETHENIINIATEYMDNLSEKTKMTVIGMIISISMLLFFITYIGWSLADYLTKPIRQLSKGVQQIAMGNFNGKLNIHTGDEIESLAISFNAMTTELQTYIKNLEQITAEKERIATELNVATNIQKNMLPCIFPPYPDRKDFDIYAVMYPAKEVGGDFYDFYLLDENHLVITIADVSDKGIPAAMFMVITKTILKNFVMSMTSPDDFSAVVQCANRQLCENNEEMMFVTVFMGMLDLKTGKFIYVNAGHTPPMIRHKRKDDSTFEYLPVEKNCVLGINEEAQFKQQEVYLKQGDELFLYTDGVTEAINKEKKLYSIERLYSNLNKINQKSSCQDILRDVKLSIDEFAQGMYQSDDITMLAIKLNYLDLGDKHNGK